MDLVFLECEGSRLLLTPRHDMKQFGTLQYPTKWEDEPTKRKTGHRQTIKKLSLLTPGIEPGTCRDQLQIMNILKM